MRSSLVTRWKAFLIFCIFAGKQTLLDTSSEFQQLAFGVGVTMEGQFLASLAPSSSRQGCLCPQVAHQQANHPVQASQLASPDLALISKQNGKEWRGDGPFWQVMLHDDSEHTLEFAIEALERSLSLTLGALPGSREFEKPENLEASLMRSRRRLQWTAFQTHHYGMGTVSVLPRGEAEELVANLAKEGLRSSMVPF